METERNRAMMSVEASLNARRLLLGPDSDGADYLPDWLPLLDNGAGDYLSYVMRGDAEGSLVVWRHDDPERSVECHSLRELVERSLGHWAAASVRTEVELVRVSDWEKSNAPDVMTLARGRSSGSPANLSATRAQTSAAAAPGGDARADVSCFSGTGWLGQRGW